MKTESFYTPPTTPSGDRDWRREVNDWMRQRNNGAHPIDLNTMVVIDNLLDALDGARKELAEAKFELSGSDELVGDLEAQVATLMHHPNQKENA